jgi:hypothetical protein
MSDSKKAITFSPKNIPSYDIWKEKYNYELNMLFDHAFIEVMHERYNINYNNELNFERFCHLIYDTSSKYMSEC